MNPGVVASDSWRVIYAVPILGTIFRGFCSIFALTVEQGAAVSAAAAVAPRPADEEEGLYLQPYYLPLGLALPFETIGPFAGPIPARPALPADEPAQSRELWRLCEQHMAAAQ